MRPTRPERLRHARGLTLLEMIIAMIITAIIVAISLFFANPVLQAVDVTTRAELTDIADNALQRIGRDVRLALPNSVRVDVTERFVEFIPLRTGGRYRAEAVGACATVNDDHLAFGAADGCFKSIGQIPNDASVTTTDFLILNNYGEGFTSQDAYAGGNRRQISAAITGQQQVNYAAGVAFDRNLHDSPGRRFFIATTPVSYVCDLGTGTITRYEGYGFGAIQPTTFSSGTSALIASNVADCRFRYSLNVAPMIGLLALTLKLSKATTTGTESVTLYHSVHVNNVP